MLRKNKEYLSKTKKELRELTAKGDPKAAKERERRSTNRVAKAKTAAIDYSWEERTRKNRNDRRYKLFTKRHNQLIRFIKNPKSQNFFEHVSYSPKELQKYFKKAFHFWNNLFGLDLNFDNYGSKWSIDHVKPRLHSDFFYHTITDESAFRKCFSLENLRPTPVSYNAHKGSYFYRTDCWYFVNKRPKKDNRHADPKKIEIIEQCESLYESYQYGKEIFEQIILEQKEYIPSLRKEFRKTFTA